MLQGPSGRASVGRADRDGSGGAVDGDELAVGESAGGVDRADDRGEAVLPGDDGPAVVIAALLAIPMVTFFTGE